MRAQLFVMLVTQAPITILRQPPIDVPLNTPRCQLEYLRHSNRDHYAYHMEIRIEKITGVIVHRLIEEEWSGGV